MSIMAQRKQRVSFDDFEEMLLMKPEEEKWELINGILVKSMVGARWEHHQLVSNVDFALRNHVLKMGRPCVVFRETFFLKQRSDDLAALPDVMVRCGDRLTPNQTSIDDPLVLIEVVSLTSEKRDRMDKRAAYQALPSLQHYVLIERDRMFVDVYTRKDDGWHGAPQLTKPEDMLRLPALDFAMSVGDIYAGVIGNEGRDR